MKTRLLSTIALLFVGMSLSLAQGHESAAGRTDPLPGSPVPNPPPGCIPPPVPVITPYYIGGQLIPYKLAWKPVSGATGYYVCVSKRGSNEAHCTSISAFPIPPGGVYSCIYDDLPDGTYDFYLKSYNSGCASAYSKPYGITLSHPVPQDIDPGNNPYDVDLYNLLLDYNGAGGDRIATSSGSESAISEAQGLGIYPNPVGSTLNVNVPFTLSKSATFSVSDISGRVLDPLPAQISNETRAQIETSSVSPGFYVLTVTSGRNHFKQKFLKK